ncbi:MAG: glycoside-pentoside-hexuronide (GPH):cation symporter [Clostridiales bacterium]|nr:glycoside-pentoside-hexuronide (GPH):cation symporter [Clostridiales bacterium]
MGKETKAVKPFGIKDKLGYMFGDFGNDFTFIFASMYVLVFYTKVMGISAGIVGTMFLVARCIDAFTDISMGRIVDSAKTAKDGKFRCWIRRMCGPVAIASFLMYQSGLRDCSMNVKIIYMFVTYILWGSVFYTSINIPYGSMASVISDNPKDRSSLSVFRSLGAGIASIMISVIAPLVIYYQDANGNQVVDPGKMTLIAGIFSVCSIVCYLLCYFMTTERVKIEPKVVDKTANKMSIATTLKEIFSSRAMIGIILSALLMLLASLMTQGINQYLFADYFKNTKALSIYSMLSLPAMILLAMCSTKLAIKFGKKECAAFGCAFSGIMYVILYFMHIQNVWIFVVLAFIGMLGMNFFSMQTYALVTDVIDDKEVATGNRDDGTIYGVYSFARKIGQAIAGGLSGWALTAIGYSELAAAQTEQVKGGIYFLATGFPGIVYVLCAVVLCVIYPLSKKKVDANVAILNERRK